MKFIGGLVIAVALASMVSAVFGILADDQVAPSGTRPALITY